MEDFLSQHFGDLVGRWHGPMDIRMYIQTSVAVILAIRAGLRDAREGNPPYFWALAFNADHRRELLRQGWKDVAILFVVALILDVVYQVVVLPTVYPAEAVIVAILLAVVPYLLVRATVTRLFGKKNPKP